MSDRYAGSERVPGTVERSGVGEPVTTERDGEARSAVAGWEQWLDGRPHRLKRGKHYTGDPKAVLRRARAAAAEASKVAVSALESQGKYEYLWIQFVDGEVPPGEPCPVCGGEVLAKTQKYFLRCSTCGSILKAADDWEVTAGEFHTSPVQQAPVDEVQADDYPPAETLAQFRGVRLLDSAGRPTAMPRTGEAFDLEVSISFADRMASVQLKVGLAVLSAGAVMQVERRLGGLGPGTADVRVGFPPDLLMPKAYSVELALFVLPEQGPPESGGWLVDREALTFRPEKTSVAQPWWKKPNSTTVVEWKVEEHQERPATREPRE